MKILVTGGAGYVGTELVKALAADSRITEIIIFDNLYKDQYSFFLGHTFEGAARIRFVNGDLLDSRNLRKQLDGVEVVYHLAAKVTTPFANRDPHFFEQVNNWGTAELVYAIEESDSVKQFVYTSSTSVYGSSKKLVTEDSEVNPRTFYGISKMRGEEHVQRLLPKVKTHILRLGNVYGYSRSMRFDAVINRFMFDAHFNNRIQIHGSGKQHRAFIHVDVIARLLSDLLDSEAPGGIYNVVDRNISVLDIVDALKEIYKNMEYIFINQHLDLRELKVDPASALREYHDYKNTRGLQEELEDFNSRYSF